MGTVDSSSELSLPGRVSRVFTPASTLMLFALISAVFYAERRAFFRNELGALVSSLDLEGFLAFHFTVLAAFAALLYWYLTRPLAVYVLDYDLWQPKREEESKYACTRERFKALLENARETTAIRAPGFDRARTVQSALNKRLTPDGEPAAFTQESIDFQMRIFERNGVGDFGYFPEMLWAQSPNMAGARDEAETVMFGAIDNVLLKTKLTPKDIDILIVNCSLFNPTPSLASMIVHKYGMNSSIRSFNLGGMGCGAAPIAVDLARDLLQSHAGKRALLISTENITQNFYFGQDRGMLLPNTLFRMGCSATVLTNKRSDVWRCKYKLLHTVRTHLGGRPEGYRAIFEEEDSEGIRGGRLSKELGKVAGEAILKNLQSLGPKALPVSEKLRYAWNMFCRRVLGKKGPAYVPNFKKAFQHFCIHTGGRGVIDKMEKTLSLTPGEVEPSRATLYRWGNTSSSSVWYELAFIEKKRRIRAGQRVWQIGFGSGFKCNSAVWEALPAAERVGFPHLDTQPWDERAENAKASES